MHRTRTSSACRTPVAPSTCSPGMLFSQITTTRIFWIITTTPASTASPSTASSCPKPSSGVWGSRRLTLKASTYRQILTRLAWALCWCPVARAAPRPWPASWTFSHSSAATWRKCATNAGATFSVVAGSSWRIMPMRRTPGTVRRFPGYRLRNGVGCWTCTTAVTPTLTP